MIKLSSGSAAISSYTIPPFVHPEQQGGTVNYVIVHNLNTNRPLVELFQAEDTAGPSIVYDWNIAGPGWTHGYFTFNMTPNSLTLYMGRLAGGAVTVGGIVYKLN